MSFMGREPQSANEGYLRQIVTGQESPFAGREPQSANEEYLKEIAENGVGGGGTLVATAEDGVVTLAVE